MTRSGVATKPNKLTAAPSGTSRQVQFRACAGEVAPACDTAERLMARLVARAHMSSIAAGGVAVQEVGRTRRVREGSAAHPAGSSHEVAR